MSDQSLADSRRAVSAAVVGNVLEWYDFAVYGYLATIIAKNFFPPGDEVAALLATFAAFGVGFLVRPLGGIVIGRIGDTRGRKVALILTILLMAVGTVLIGLIPSYSTIGVLAPILLVVARLLQGFSAGGEWGGSTAFIVEWAPANRRGFYGSFGYQYLTGTNVASNTRFDGNAGAYWKIMSRSYGALTIGANVFGMGYSKNLRYFTYGQGGYFSPQEYLLLNAPVRWVGRYKRNFEYSITASLGSQQFHEDASPFFPTDPALQGKSGPYYPGQSVSGANYNVEFRGSYHLPGNWYLSAYMNMNNALDYNQQIFGFSLRYLFRDSLASPEMMVPTIPDWKGLQPFNLP